MSVDATRALMDRYFAAMGAGQDFAPFYADDATWTMVDSGQVVRGAPAVRDYVLDLHARMRGGSQGPLVVAHGLALLEGDSVEPPDGAGPGLFYCLVFEVREDRISAVRCYGSPARLMAGRPEG